MSKNDKSKGGDLAEELFRLARDAMANAHAPYSKYSVGAAIRTDDGRLYSGCNVENASFPEGWCAETSAIAHMVRDGGGTIAEIAVICDRVEKIPPCGGCCQRISEFGNSQTIVHLCDAQGVAETISLSALLPMAFDM